MVWLSGSVGGQSTTGVGKRSSTENTTFLLPEKSQIEQPHRSRRTRAVLYSCMRAPTSKKLLRKLHRQIEFTKQHRACVPHPTEFTAPTMRKSRRTVVGKPGFPPLTVSIFIEYMRRKRRMCYSLSPADWSHVKLGRLESGSPGTKL